MFISEKVVFLELPKTACTHIRDILKDILGGEFVGKHNQVSSNIFTKKKLFLGSIRDPWEWYLSLWAYGCGNNNETVASLVTKPGIKFRGIGWRNNPYGAFRTFLACLSANPEKWKRTYQDINDASAFREWLYMIHDKKYYYDFVEGYGASPLSLIAGLLTYRYIKLFCCKDDELKNMDALSTFGQLVAYEKDNCFIDIFIRNESLESDLLYSLGSSGFEVSSKNKSEIMLKPRTNTTKKKYMSTYYYDSDSENLIFERERLIVEKFGYVAPSSRN